MAREPERITITFALPEVGVEYHPATSEAELGDKLAALELGAHALALQAILARESQGLPVPEILRAFVAADTWREFQ